MTVDLSRRPAAPPVLDADTALQALLAAPPAGHTPIPQPDDWYERVFDAMACAHPEACACGEAK